MRESRTHRLIPPADAATKAHTLETSYFDRLYSQSTDPWGFTSRWYERRKYDLTLASLIQPHYGDAFEAGCSIGVLTALLAARCDRLLAVDASAQAVRQASARTESLPQVTIEQRRLPEQWPPGRFDLIVLSEIGYYFCAADLTRLVTATFTALRPGGTLVATHWRHPVADYPLGGDDVHEAIADCPALERTVRHEEADFRLDVFMRIPPAARSVAQTEGLVT
jgi:SAM-dependent methyltransferase